MQKPTKPRNVGSISTTVTARALTRVTGGHWGVGNGLTAPDAEPAETVAHWGVGNGRTDVADDDLATIAHWGVGNG